MTTKSVDHGPLGDLVVGSAIRASFLKKMLENRMILEIAQEEKWKVYKNLFVHIYSEPGASSSYIPAVTLPARAGTPC
jgi:hypothetical protein